jgi:putative transposase
VEVGREEAIYGRADHRIPVGSWRGRAGKGAVSQAPVLRAALLRVAEQLRWHGGVGRQEAEGARDLKREAQAVTGGGHVGERGDEGGPAKKMVTAPLRRELVRWIQTKGISERRSPSIAGMSASALRYRARPDRNVERRERIVSLAQRPRRYGAGMIYLKLRQVWQCVNYKRVERLYQLEKSQVNRRHRLS